MALASRSVNAVLSAENIAHVVTAEARSIIGAALMLPIVVPGIITAAALFGIYRGLGLNGTLTGLIIGPALRDRHAAVGRSGW